MRMATLDLFQVLPKVLILCLRQSLPQQKKENDGLFLEVAIPYAGRLKTKDKEFHRMLTACDGVKVISDHYVPSCYMNRNRYMVAQSQRVIAVYDGRGKGGTLFTLRDAHVQGREIRLIEI